MTRILPIPGRWSDQTPTVVVSGLPRSGTSMMMQILAAGGLPILADGVRGADDDNPRGYYELEAVKDLRQDATWLRNSAGKAVKVIHALVTDLPTDRPYRVILMRRKIENVVKSQAAMLDRLGHEGANMKPEELASTFEQQLEHIKDYMNRHACFEFLEVWYGAILEFPQTQIERVNQFLSGELNTDAMIAAVDPTLRRN